MNTRSSHARIRGHLQVDLLIAIGLVVLGVLPLGFGFVHHRKLVRDATTRAIVLELLDGEMEILAAGEHRSFTNAVQTFPLKGAAVLNLPPGTCTLTRSTPSPPGIDLALEWKPERAGTLQPVRRTIRIPSQP